MIKVTPFYNSSNGDRWVMVHDDATGRFVVRHEPNLSSGGQASDTTAAEFLARSGATPQGEALKALLDGKGALDSED